MLTKLFSTLFFISLLTFSYASAQISTPGTPFSFSRSLDDFVSTKNLPTVNVQELIREDRQNLEKETPLPPRFGFAHEVSFGVDNAGTWTEVTDGRIWRLRVISKGAFSINLIFSEFYMPQGASLFIYNEDRSEVIGAFTELNNKSHGGFSTQPIEGDAVTLEYHEPEEVKGKGKLKLARVVHAYKNKFGKDKQVKNKEMMDYGDSASCNININCTEGNNWQDEKNSVAMILLDNGTRICSGALINNEREDYIPYFLTAFHCADISENGSLSSSEINDVESWIFMFNYESPTCSNQDGTTLRTVSGSTIRAGNDDTDFLLVEMSENPSHHYNPYFAGWTRSTNLPTSVVGIHHPAGDIKKIATDSDTPSLTSITGGSNTHWYVSNWDIGTTEGGSSGSPLFDQNHRIIGQDHAGDGYSACHTNKGTYYGAISSSWNNGGSASTRLRDWLDPDNTGLTVLNGAEGPQPPPAPTNFTLTNPGSSFPSFSWNASTGADSYKIYQRCDHGYYGDCGPFLSEIGTTSSTSYTDYSVIQGGSGQQEHYEYSVRAINSAGASEYSNRDDVYGKSSFKKINESLPTEVALEQNYPNPFNPVTQIKFSLTEQEEVQLTVYDGLGRTVKELVSESLSAGFYTVAFNASGLSSGIYLYKLETPSFTQTRTMSVIK